MKILKGANLPPLIFGLILFIVGLFFLRLPPSIPTDALSSPITELPQYYVQELFLYLKWLTISMPLIVAGLISVALGLAIRKEAK